MTHAAASRPTVSVAILSWNTEALLAECLDDVREACDGISSETIVVDNASSDGSAEMVESRFPWVRLVRNPVNDGYAKGVNHLLALARGEWVLLLGSDTRPAPDSIRKMIAFAATRVPGLGCVAPRLVNPDGTIQRACMRWPGLATLLWWDTPLGAAFPKSDELVRYQYLDWDHRGTREVEQPPGTCLLVPRSTVERVGTMDGDLWLFFNDVDWCRRMRDAGLARWYLDEAVVVHHQGASTKKYADFAPEWHRNRIAYYRKHHGRFGKLLAKTVLAFVAIREIFRVRRGLGSWKETRPHARQITRTMTEILKR